jgi:predicted DNA-binding transcriptional regulator YafY
MVASERRKMILKILCRRKHETVQNLAIELGVSERTIRRDIDLLSISEPIYTQVGRHGGVYIMDGYTIDRMYMEDIEIQVLQKVGNKNKLRRQLWTR